MNPNNNIYRIRIYKLVKYECIYLLLQNNIMLTI